MHGSKPSQILRNPYPTQNNFQKTILAQFYFIPTYQNQLLYLYLLFVNPRAQTIAALPSTTKECLPIPSELNCLQINQSLYDTQRQLVCLQCQTPFHLPASTPFESLCEEVHKFQFEINTPDAQADTCQFRHASKDLCLKCPEDKIFNNAFNGCTDIPTGISGCEIYLSESICSWCGAGLFLSENECRVNSKTITNCKYYRADGVCGLCEGGYQLKVAKANDPTLPDVTECIDAKVTNCQGYNVISGECNICDITHYLIRLAVPSASDPNVATTNVGLQIGTIRRLETVVDPNAETTTTTISTPTSYEKHDLAGSFKIECRLNDQTNCDAIADNINSFFTPPSASALDKLYFELNEFPEYVLEDSDFKANSICQRCKVGFVKKGNLCEAQTVDTDIPKCIRYSIDSQCMQCDFGFVLTKEL